MLGENAEVELLMAERAEVEAERKGANTSEADRLMVCKVSEAEWLSLTRAVPGFSRSASAFSAATRSASTA